jgi:hypothetical protein
VKLKGGCGDEGNDERGNVENANSDDDANERGYSGKTAELSRIKKKAMRIRLIDRFTLIIRLSVIS